MDSSWFVICNVVKNKRGKQMNNKVDIDLLLRLQGECETSQELTERYKERTG